MAVTAKLFGKYLYHVVLGDTNAQHKWEDNTIKCVLCTGDSNISTENAQDTLEYYSELTGEITGDGYTEGGMAISYDAGKTSTYSGTDNTITFDGDAASVSVGNVISARSWRTGMTNIVKASRRI